MRHSNEERWVLLEVAVTQADNGLWGSALHTVECFRKELFEHRDTIEPIDFAYEDRFSHGCATFCIEHIDERLQVPGAKSLGGPGSDPVGEALGRVLNLTASILVNADAPGLKSPTVEEAAWAAFEILGVSMTPRALDKITFLAPMRAGVAPHKKSA